MAQDFSFDKQPAVAILQHNAIVDNAFTDTFPFFMVCSIPYDVYIPNM